MRGEVPQQSLCWKNWTYLGRMGFENGDDYALVPLGGVLFRGCLPRERIAASRQRDLGSCLPESLRDPAWGRVVVLDGQCLVGPLQPGCRLSAGVPGRELRTAQDPTRPCPRGGHPGLFDPGRSCIRPVPRGAVRLGPGSVFTYRGRSDG